jgi:conjugative transfer region protein (TIGR03748 family)
MKIKVILIVLLSIVFMRPCWGDESMTQAGRYLTISTKPKASQINLLSQIIQVRFPQNIQTIRDGMHYLLRFSGYSLIPDSWMSKEFRLTLSKPLPLIDRELGPISLKDSLLVLAGPAFSLVEYPIKRDIDFKLKPEFQIARTNHWEKYL